MIKTPVEWDPGTLPYIQMMDFVNMTLDVDLYVFPIVILVYFPGFRLVSICGRLQESLHLHANSKNGLASKAEYIASETGWK